MRRICGLAHFLRQFREQLPNDIIRRKAVRVFCFEILLANYTAVVNVEKSRMRHPFVHALHFCIQDVKAANDFGIGIGQQGKLHTVALGKVREASLNIVANRGQLDALLLESRFGVLQLHELRFAKRSPVRGTEEKNDRPFGAL